MIRVFAGCPVARCHIQAMFIQFAGRFCATGCCFLPVKWPEETPGTSEPFQAWPHTMQTTLENLA